MKRALAALAAVIFVAGCTQNGGRSSSLTAPGAVLQTGEPADPCLGSRTSTTTEDPCETGSGRFTGGGFQIVSIEGVQVKVTRGFTIHCDNLLTNNLEVNWGGGNNFHMDKNSLQNIVCTRPDDPRPPAAPVSRISASSSGLCNGSAATTSFILEDHGEPGTNDRAELIIAGACSLNVSLRNLDGGNIQAHFDQPHK
jgi:hypothetical protein